MTTKNNILKSIPNNLENEVTELLASSKNVKIKRIISKGHKTPESEWYDQDENEWVMVLSGEAVLLFEDESTVRLKSGDFVNIPAHKKHKVQWTAPDVETIWLAVHY